MEIHPRPCPFCGAIPEIYPKDPTQEGSAWGMVQCTNGDCPAEVRVCDGEHSADDRGSYAYKATAIRRWNTRAEDGEAGSGGAV